MKKAFLLIFVSMILLLAFASCDMLQGVTGGGQDTPAPEDEHVHEWIDATCKTAKTCATCGEKVPGTLPHTLVEATCTEPKTCSVCKQTWGEALGHNLSLATCTTPSTCRRCQLTEGEAPGHDWAEPTCTKPKTCKTCATTEGESLGHDYEVVSNEATCTEGGSTTHTCTRCNDTYTDNIVAALGHLNDVTLEAVAPTCTDNGLTAGVGCSRCGEATTPQRPVAALGHEATSFVVDPTCTEPGYTAYHCDRCGEDFKGDNIPALGHSYGDASCTDAAVCSVCGFDNDGAAIGHDWAEATCTEPKMCKREGCGVTEGEALGHNMSEGSCLAPMTCLNGCGYTEGEKATHKLTYSASNGVSTYTCSSCKSSFKCEVGYTLDGSHYDGMTGVLNTTYGFTTNPDMPQYPEITEDGYYQLLRIEESADPKQLQVWVPKDNTDKSYFTSGNGSVGFFSFKFNGYMDTNFSMQFADGSSSGSRWSEEWAIADRPFTLKQPTVVDGRTIVRAVGWDDIVLYEKDVTDTGSLFTGWFHVMMGIVLDAETDTITLYYYVDGEYVGFATRALTISTNGINDIYISGNTKAQGSGIMLDDVAFGYTVAGSWIFDGHQHSWTAGSTVDPTCVSDGYTEYACACGASIRGNLVDALGHVNDIIVEGVAPTCTETGLTDGVQCSACGEMTKAHKLIDALGHTEIDLPATLPTCTEDGHNPVKLCTTCNEYTTEYVGIPATGHSYVAEGYDATCTASGFKTHTCSACGDSYDETLAPKGHDYGTAKCTEAAVCIVCNTPSDGIIGHNFAPATCTEPAICTRGCNTTEGEPLGHTMAPATCMKLATCEVCGHTEGELASHNLQHKYVKGVLTYYCADCDKSYAIDKGYYLDGSNHDGWIGRGNAQNYTVSTGHLPAVVDGHYELINKNGKRGQMQLWIPDESKEEMGFDSENNALGYVSFKLNTYISSDSLDVKLVDSISNQGDNRWTENGVAAALLTIKPVTDGYTKLLADDGTVLANIAVGEDNFTGWIDFKVAIELNGEFDQITLHYFLDGKHVYSMSKTLTTLTNSVNSVYFSGYSTAKGSGIMLDDVAFGFTANGEYEFDTCAHTFVDPNCSTNKYCSICGYIESGKLGHRGGTATCNTLAVCEDCGQSYGDYKHNMTEATCIKASVCNDCGMTDGLYKNHNITITADGAKMKYSCDMCGAYYYIDTFYKADGTSRDFAYVVNGGATIDHSKGYYDVIWDGSEAATNPNTGKDGSQPQLWIPGNAADTGLKGFSCANNALGVLSFRMQISDDITDGLVIQAAKERSATDWSGWDTSSVMLFTIGRSTADGSSIEIRGDLKKASTVLTTIPVVDGWTDWFSVDVFIQLSSDNSITLYYYVNDVHVGTFSGPMPIDSLDLRAVYIQGWVYNANGGFRLDDFVFGYTAGGELVPGAQPEAPDTPTQPDEPEVKDTTFAYTDATASEIKSDTLKTIVASKIKQCDQANPGSDTRVDYFAEGGTPRYVKAQRADGTTVDALYFSRSVPWIKDQKVHFTEFRFAVNSEQPGAFVTKITFDYIIKGTVETNDRYTFTDLEGNKFSADAYVQIKTPANHPLAGDNYPELSGTDLTLDGAWHTMTIDFGADGVEIIDILLNLYHFQGEMMIANLNIEYRV